jgi:DNA polymerase III subunit gamma/tau
MAGDAPGTAHENPAGPGAPQAAARLGPPRLALYRRYRPATFAEVRGQEHVTEPLRQALLNGRVNHAYLFSGPRGCGKTSSARILARSLNCAEGPTPDPCGVCESCVALAPSGPGSIDVIEIDAASHGGVDDARDLRERAFYAPVAGRFKVYIIDEAHMVTREGFNALLKLVEEPPPHLKFVFATTEPEKVIATIRSRTHHYPFRLVPPAVLRELLEEILAAEGVACQPSVIPLVVRAGAGSVRDSLSVLDQLLAGSGEEGLTYERTVALLGYTDDSLLDEMVSAFATGDGAAVFGTVERVIQGGHDPRRFAADLLDRLRDLIILAAVPGAGKTGLLDAPADRLERMAGQAGSFGQAELARAAEILNEGLIQMRGTTSPRLILELMCAQVLLPGAGTGERALLARLERLERRLAGPAPAGDGGHPDDGQRPSAAPAQPAAPTQPAAPAQPGAQGEAAGSARAAGEAEAESGPAPGGGPDAGTGAAHGARAPRDGRPADPAAPGGRPAAGAGTSRAAGVGHARQAAQRGEGAVDLETFRRRWGDILEAVREERKVAWILLRAASIASFDHGMLTISFPREGDARGFTSSGCDQVLKGVAGRLLGVPVRVNAVVNPGQPAQAHVPSAAPPPMDEPGGTAGPRAAGRDPGRHDPGHSETAGQRGTARNGARDAGTGHQSPGQQGAGQQSTGQHGAESPGPGGAGGGPTSHGAGPHVAGQYGPSGHTGGPAGTAGPSGHTGGPAETAGPSGHAGGPAGTAGPSGHADGPSGRAKTASRSGTVPAAAERPRRGRLVPGTSAPKPRRPAAHAPGAGDDFAAGEWPDDAGEGDPSGVNGLTGMELIQRQLGGRVIEEIDET